MTDPSADRMEELEAAVEDQSIPRYYMNGLMVARSVSDVFVVMTRMGTPIGIVNMSFTTAKTLVQSLNSVLQELERKTGHEILTMEEIGKKFQEGGSE